MTDKINSPSGESVSGEERPTDGTRLNWLVDREAYIMEHKTVPRWGVYSSQACLEMLAGGYSPRAAIDAAMAREKSDV